MPQLKDRMNFTISHDVKARLESRVPRTRRSAFVEQAIDRALTDSAGQELLEFLDTLPRVRPEDGDDAVATVQRIRREMYQSAVGIDAKTPEA